MDAIKKKMQAMKVEKDNAMDRSDVCEQAAKDAKVVLFSSGRSSFMLCCTKAKYAIRCSLLRQELFYVILHN